MSVPGILTLLVGMAVALLLFLVVSRVNEQRVLAEFQREAADLAHDLRVKVQRNIDQVTALAAFYEASEAVTRAEFSRFTRDLLGQHPDVLAFDWIPRVPDARRAALEAAARAEGTTDFQVRDPGPPGTVGPPAGRRAEYYPILYSEPLEENLVAVGYDMHFDPIRRSVLEAARDTGSLAASVRLRVIQDPRLENPGILLALPVYRGTAIPGDVGARQATLQGFVAAVYRVGDLVRGAMPDLAARRLAVEIRDLSAPAEERLLYTSGPAGGADAPEHAADFSVGNRRHEVVLRATPDYLAGKRQGQRWAFLAIGVAVSLALTGAVEIAVRRARAAAEQAARTHQVVRATLDAMLVMDETDRVLDWNPAAERLTGWPAAEAIGRTVEELLIPPARREARRRTLAAYLAGPMDQPVVREAEMLFLHRDGHAFPAEVTVTAMREGGRTLFVGVFRDLRERRAAEAALRESQANLLALTEGTPDVIFLKDLQGRYLMINAAASALVGKPRAEILGRDDRALFPADAAEAVIARDLAALAAGAPQAFEVTLPFPDGPRTLLEIKGPLKDPDGAVRGLFGISRDITDRKRAEQALQVYTAQLEILRDSSAELTRELDLGRLLDVILERMTALFHTTHGSLYLWDEAGHALVPHTWKGHGPWEAQLRYPLGQGVAGTVAERREGVIVNEFRTSPFATPQVLAETTHAAVLGEPLLVRERLLGVITIDRQPGAPRFTPADQDLLRLFAGQASIAIENARLFDAARREIAAREAAEAALHALNAQLEERVGQRTAEVVDLYNNAPCGYHSLDADGVYVHVNDTELRWLGYTREEVVGKLRFADVLTEASLARFGASFEEFKRSGRSPQIEYDLVRKDGSVFPIHIEATAVTDAAGHFVMSRATMFDITARKQAEAAVRQSRDALATANAELQRAARMKDDFLANMSHELRTPLNAVLGLAEALQEDVYGPLVARQREAIARVEESGRHLLGLINDVLDLAKVEAGKLELEPGPVPLAELCQASLQFVREAAGKKRQAVTARYDPAVPALQADGRRLKQVLVNLLTNAVKFTPEGGQLGLEVQGDPARQAVRFTVWDTGVGIPPADQARLFQPFVQLDSSLARQHEGTGLGLALVQRLAALHGGSVTLDSAPGQGSRFSVWLPWRVPAPAPAAAAPAPAAPALAGAQALVVEDLTAHAEPLVRYLAELGVRATVLPEGGQVVAQAARTSPDLILLDLGLPDVPGWTVLAQLQADPRTRAIPVVVVTVADAKPQALAAGAAAYLQKPVSRADLQAALRQAVGARPQPAALVVPAPAAPLLLLAEDNPGNVATLGDYLRAKGYRLVVARDGLEALALAHRARPACILMDVQMPGLDGLEATRRLRADPDPALAQLPIIALTALAMRGDEARCLAAGATAYLAKPVRLQELAETVARLVGGAKT